MTYEQFVDEVFTDHHDHMGMDEDEILELIEDTTFEQRKKWLKRNGYDLSQMFDLAKEYC